MSGVVDRITEVLKEELAPFLTGFCWGAEVDVNEDQLLITADELAADLATTIQEALNLTEEWASVTDGGRGHPFSTPDGAQRSLEVVESNNRSWLKSHDTVPDWARNAHIQHRFVTPWLPSQSGDTHE